MYNPIDCDTLVCYLHEWIASTLIDGRYLDWLPLPRLTADASSDAGQAASRSDAHMLREVIRPKSRLAEELLADVSDVLGREGTLPGRPGMDQLIQRRPGKESLSRSGTVSSPEQSLQNAEQVFQWAFGTVYGDMKAAGLDVTPFVASSLISVCAAAGLGHLGAAMQVFEDLQRGRGGQPNTEVYSALINLCAKEGQIETAFTLYRQMAERGLAPNAYTFASLLDACAVAGDVDRANAVFTAMKDLMSGDRHEREKRERERGRGGVAVGAGGGGGVLGVGRREGKPFGVSQKGPQPLPDNVAFNNVLKLFRKHEMVDDALALYQEMKAPGGAAGCLAPTASLSTC
eukprot:jgi/Mesvir1/29753/Mv04978-RA.1